MVKNTWEDKLITKEELDIMYDSTNGFIDDKLPDLPPVRPEGESFSEFVAKGAENLIKENPELVEKLL